MFTTYIIKSLKDGKYYYGSTANFPKRLKEHNSGKVKSTKHRRPFTLHYKEISATKTEALNREKFFKSIEGYLWLKNSGII